jgi:acylphosphatase
MVRYNIIVNGYVQGVGFRYFVRITASNYGINGWVRNKMNGTVEIDAEGNEINMNKFIEVIKKGNRFSEVEDISINEIRSYENYRDFNIVDDDY